MPADEDRNAHPDADYFRAHHPSRHDLPAEYIDPPGAHDDGSLADELFGLTLSEAIHDAQRRRSRRRVLSRIFRRNTA